MRPLPVRDPRAVAPPGASLALPAGPSFEPPWIADPLRASLHPLSALPCRSSQSERPRALPAGPVSPSLSRRGTEAPRLQFAPLRPGPSDRPPHPKPFGLSPSPVPHSSTQWATLSHRLGLRGLSTHGCQADSGGSALSIRLGGPGPGLPASGRASQPRPPPPNSRAIPARRLDILASPARSGPSVSSVPTNRSASPASEVRALPASPQPGPPGLAPRAPRPGRGAGPPAGLVPVFTLPGLVGHGIQAPTRRPGFQCPRLGLAPGLPASPPAPPGRWAASAHCQR